MAIFETNKNAEIGEIVICAPQPGARNLQYIRKQIDFATLLRSEKNAPKSSQYI